MAHIFIDNTQTHHAGYAAKKKPADQGQRERDAVRSALIISFKDW